MFTFTRTIEILGRDFDSIFILQFHLRIFFLVAWALGRRAQLCELGPGVTWFALFIRRAMIQAEEESAEILGMV